MAKDTTSNEGDGDGLGKAVPVFTAREKADLREHIFRSATLDHVDFRDADLRFARFDRCSLRGAVFTGAFLVGTEFLDCDLRGAHFARVQLGRNRFDRSWLTGAHGLSERAREIVLATGGRFLVLIQGKRDPRKIRDALKSGRAVADEAFDCYLPDHLAGRSDQFWTPLHVAMRASEWLVESGARTVLDVGAGVGKFCVAGALVTNCEFVALEQRSELVTVGRALSAVFGVQDRVKFVEGRLGEVSVRGFDAYYFYNPFGENLFGSGVRLDDSVELNLARWTRDVRTAELLIDHLPIGARVITYNGFGGYISDCYTEVHVDRTLPNILRMWRRVRAKTNGRFRLDTTRE